MNKGRIILNSCGVGILIISHYQIIIQNNNNKPKSVVKEKT